VLLSVKRYHAAVAGGVGIDFLDWFAAARAVSSGRTPYSVHNFVYPPTLALSLAPFVHVSTVRVWKMWTASEIGALAVGVGAFVAAAHLRTWRGPVLLAFCSVTVLHFWPVTIGLFFGQSDAFVFAALLIACYAVGQRRLASHGGLIGLAGLLKGWPFGVGWRFSKADSAAVVDSWRSRDGPCGSTDDHRVRWSFGVHNVHQEQP